MSKAQIRNVQPNDLSETIRTYVELGMDPSWFMELHDLLSRGKLFGRAVVNEDGVPAAYALAQRQTKRIARLVEFVGWTSDLASIALRSLEALCTLNYRSMSAIIDETSDDQIGMLKAAGWKAVSLERGAFGERDGILFTKYLHEVDNGGERSVSEPADDGRVQGPGLGGPDPVWDGGGP